jgi:hypothetical protein
MSPSKWHRRVSPLFMLLLIIAGLAVGSLVYLVAGTLLAAAP